MQSLQVLADSTQQTAHDLQSQDIHSCRMSLEMPVAQHRQLLEDEIGQLKRLHLLQVIRNHLLLQCTHVNLKKAVCECTTFRADLILTSNVYICD